MAQASGWVDAPRVIAERDRILTDPEFALEPTRLQRWLESVSEALVDALRALPLWALWALLGLLAVVIVVALVRMLPTRGGRRADIGVDPGAAVSVRATGYEALRAQASAAIGAGAFAEAVRLTWLAALALIARRGLSDGRAARADWEHVTAVRFARPELADTLAALARAFQGTRFGADEASAARARACWEALSRLEAALDASAGRAA